MQHTLQSVFRTVLIEWPKFKACPLQGLTGSLCLALSELGEGRSSSENRLAVRFRASSIMGNSSSCSSGSRSANDGEVRVLKLGVCFSMLLKLTNASVKVAEAYACTGSASSSTPRQPQTPCRGVPQQPVLAVIIQVSIEGKV